MSTLAMSRWNARISQFCCMRFCRYTQPPPELWAFQALPVCFCMEILEPLCSDAKANAKSPQLLVACCICTAGFLIRSWGACGQSNQESFCRVLLLNFVAEMQSSLSPQKRLLAVIQWLSFMFNICTNGFCGVPTTPPRWRDWPCMTETHLYEGTSVLCKNKLQPHAKFGGAGCL